jgi:hypothetical protein
MANDEERKFRLRPRKPAVRRERRPLATAYKIIMHYARVSGVRKRRSSSGTSPKRTRPYCQRCAVRVMYAKNRTGQWKILEHRAEVLIRQPAEALVWRSSRWIAN